MLKVLVADDTMLIAAVIKYILEETGEIEVVGVAEDGRQAVEMARKLKPDLITMDIYMPVLDGLGAIREIMTTEPLPIIVVSTTVDLHQQHESFEAIEEGALAVLPKPPAIDSQEFADYCRMLVSNVRAMAEVKVVRRTAKRKAIKQSVTGMTKSASTASINIPQMVLLGTSTGGPYALHTILQDLPREFPLPIVIVQHITPGFLDGLVSWMQSKCELSVKVAQQGETLKAGVVYFSPDDCHLEIETNMRSQLSAKLLYADPEGGFRPSVNHLFHSVARRFPKAAIAGLLTGMGSDGAQGLLALRHAGSFTFAQDEESSVVYGMPAAAVELNAASEVVPLADISVLLRNMTMVCENV